MSLWTIGEKSAGSQQPAPPPPAPHPPAAGPLLRSPPPRSRGRPGARGAQGAGRGRARLKREARGAGRRGRWQGERRAGTGAAGAWAGPRREGGRSGRASAGGGASAGESDRPPKHPKVPRGRRGPPGPGRSRRASPWHARWKVFKAAKARPRARGPPSPGCPVLLPPLPAAGTGRCCGEPAGLRAYPGLLKSLEASSSPAEQVPPKDLPSPPALEITGRRQESEAGPDVGLMGVT